MRARIAVSGRSIRVFTAWLMLTGCSESNMAIGGASGTLTSSSEDGAGTSGDPTTLPSDPSSSTGESDPDCEIPEYRDDMALDSEGAVSLPGEIDRLVGAGNLVVACGDGFLAIFTPSTGGLALSQEASLAGRCTGVAVADDTNIATTMHDGRLHWFGFDATQDPILLHTASVPDTSFHAVLTSEDRLVVSAGVAGLIVYQRDGDTLTELTRYDQAQDARHVAAFSDFLLVADGVHGALLLRAASGAFADRVELHGTATRSVVDGDTAFVLRGGSGFNVITRLDESLVDLGSQLIDGIALDAVTTDDSMLLAAGSAVLRYDLNTRGLDTLLSREDRPAVGQARTAWLRGIVESDDGAIVAIGSELVPMTVDAPARTAVSRMEATTHSMWGDHVELLVPIENRGTAELLLEGVSISAPFTATIPPQFNTARPGCPGQFVAPPGHSLFVSVVYQSDEPSHEQATLLLHSNDPEPRRRKLRVEANRPTLDAGSAAPDISLLTLDGDHFSLSSQWGKVTFLKFYDPT